MLKAAAACLPVIAFDVAGSREAVNHLKTGILVPPDDIKALQTAIATLYEEKEIREKMGVGGRNRMAEEFAVQSMADRYLDVYSEILNG